MKKMKINNRISYTWRRQEPLARDNLKKYINSNDVILKLCKKYTKMKVYYILHKCNISYDIEMDEDIEHLKEQIKLNNITEDECIVCYTPNILKIQFKNCIHTTCIDCYVNMNTCYYNCHL
jgi:hypothetical protein